MQFITFKEALNQALDESLANDENVIVIGEDIKEYGGVYDVVKGLYDKYGEDRVLSTPISQSAFIGAAVGAAQTGLIPVVEMASADLLTLGMNPIINQAAKTYYLTDGQLTAPVVIRVPSGTKDGSSATESQNFESFFASIPGLKVVAPSSPAQAKGLLKAAIKDENPVVFIEYKELYDKKGRVPEEDDFEIPLGETMIENKGEDVTVVSWGPALNKVKSIANVLEKEGISVEIINPLTLYPMDMQPIIDSVIKTSRLVIVHDGIKTGGIGAEIAAKVIESDCFDYLDAPIIRVAGQDVPVPYSPELKKDTLIKNEDIINAIYTVTGMK